jgi:uncharacterized membrane protein YeiB
MDKSILVGVAILGLAAVNIAGFKYLGIFGFFVTAASVPFAQRILDIIEKV